MEAKGYNGNGGQPRLPVAVKMEARGLWPTPMADDMSNVNGASRQRKLLEGSSRAGLPAAVQMEARGLWPTPTHMDHAGSRRTTARTEAWTSNPGTTLTDAAIIAGGRWDGKPMEDGTALGRLNPRWVAQLMGYPPTWAVLSGSRPPAKRSTRGKSHASSPRSTPTDAKP
jgi:hypothetical protein